MMTPMPLGDGRWQVAIPTDWPGFAGHFPGDPLVPAAVLVDLTMQVAGPVASMRKARFPAPARPGDTLILSLHERTVRISNAAGAVAEIRLE